MPRRTSTLLTAGLGAAALLLTACGSSGSSSATGSSSSGSGRKHPHVGLQLAIAGIDFFQEVRAGAEQGAQDAGGDVSVTGPAALQPDAAVKQFTDLQSKASDGIALHAAPPDFWVRPISRAAKAGVKLTTIADAPAPGSDAGIYVGDNGERSGRVLVDKVLPYLPSRSGTVVIGNCVPGFPTQDNRIKGMVEEVKAKLPQAKVVSTNTGIDPTQNYASWQNLVATYRTDAIAFLGSCDTSGPSLVKLKKTNPGRYAIATFDINSGTLAGIKDGTMSLALGGSPYLIGYLGTRLLAESAATGQPLPKGWVDTGAEVVTKTNADSVLARESSPAARAAYYSKVMNKFFPGLSKIRTQPIGNALADQPAATNDNNPFLEAP